MAAVLVGNLARFRDPSLEQKEVKRKPDGTKTDGLKIEVAQSNREHAKQNGRSTKRRNRKNTNLQVKRSTRPKTDGLKMENEVTSVKRRNLPKRGKNEVTRMVLNLKRSILRLTTKMGIAYLARRATGNCRRSKKQNGQQRWQKKEERGDGKDAKAEKGTKNEESLRKRKKKLG